MFVADKRSVSKTFDFQAFFIRPNILPTAEDALHEKKDAKPTAKAPAKPAEQGSKVSTDPEKRRTLIRNLDFGLQQFHHNRRALDIFNELQNRLRFEDHDNAIAVLFRVLLELAIEQYIQQQKVPNVQIGDKLANKFRKTLAHMLTTNLVDKKYHDNLRKFDKSEPLFSANTLNAYVHNPDFFASDHHLKNMWDTLEKFVVTCLKS